MAQPIWVVGFRDLKPFDMVSEGEWVREIRCDGYGRYSAVVASLVAQAEVLPAGKWTIDGTDVGLAGCFRQTIWGEPRVITDGADLPEMVMRGVEPPTRSCEGKPGRCASCPGLP